MRVIVLATLLLSLAPVSHAQVVPETLGQETMSAPADGWFLIKNGETSVVFFDSNDGRMQGTLTVSGFTPAVEPNFPRNEIYAAESFYSRGVRGDRQDVLTIFDTTNLAATGEIEIPTKTANLWFRNYISLLDDARHVVVFNMTPAQSVSIVDVIDKEFDGEISTPGCALILPVANSSFVMICGDGTLQMIRLDQNGAEAGRSRSSKFFDVDKDPVFDQVARTESGWLLASHEGLVFQVSTDGAKVNLSKPWPMMNAEDVAENWRPGGYQPMGLHRGSRVLYVLMHQGEVDTHYEPGKEVWLFDIDRKKRIGRLKLEVPATAIQTTQEAAPKFLLINDKGDVDVFDGQLLRHLRTIKSPVAYPSYLQTLGRND